jgi:bifunctional non-homologous end joining protein LigD
MARQKDSGRAEARSDLCRSVGQRDCGQSPQFLYTPPMFQRPRRSTPFMEPATSLLVDVPPLGPEWLHELKADGYRMQAHKIAAAVRIFNRRGEDCSARYLRIREAVAALPCRSAILDTELIAMGETREDFWAIRRRSSAQQLYCFDILMLDGEDLRKLPLTERKSRLEALLHRANHPMVRYCEHFDDVAWLLERAEAGGFEGIVSKRRDGTYRKGTWSGWKKVKTKAWLAANKNRPEVFARKR